MAKAKVSYENSIGTVNASTAEPDITEIRNQMKDNFELQKQLIDIIKSENSEAAIQEFKELSEVYSALSAQLLKLMKKTY